MNQLAALSTCEPVIAVTIVVGDDPTQPRNLATAVALALASMTGRVPPSCTLANRVRAARGSAPASRAAAGNGGAVAASVRAARGSVPASRAAAGNGGAVASSVRAARGSASAIRTAAGNGGAVASSVRSLRGPAPVSRAPAGGNGTSQAARRSSAAGMPSAGTPSASMPSVSAGAIPNRAARRHPSAHGLADSNSVYGKPATRGLPYGRGWQQKLTSRQLALRTAAAQAGFSIAELMLTIAVIASLALAILLLPGPDMFSRSSPTQVSRQLTPELSQPPAPAPAGHEAPAPAVPEAPPPAGHEAPPPAVPEASPPAVHEAPAPAVPEAPAPRCQPGSWLPHPGSYSVGELFWQAQTGADCRESWRQARGSQLPARGQPTDSLVGGPPASPGRGQPEGWQPTDHRPAVRAPQTRSEASRHPASQPCSGAARTIAEYEPLARPGLIPPVFNPQLATRAEPCLPGAEASTSSRPSQTSPPTHF